MRKTANDEGPLRDLAQRILDGELREVRWVSIRPFFTLKGDSSTTKAWKRMAVWANANQFRWWIEPRGPFAFAVDCVVVFRPPRDPGTFACPVSR
jgi:hypothetical protein